MMPAPPSDQPRWCVVARSGPGEYAIVALDSSGGELDTHLVRADELASHVAGVEAASHPRWVWHDTAAQYPQLLADGVRVERSHDLRLCHQILRNSALVPQRATLFTDAAWAVPVDPFPEPHFPDAPDSPALFDLDAADSVPRTRRGAVPDTLGEVLREFARQRTALASATDSRRLGLLLAAESAGALIAAELTSAGIPWDSAEHDRILSDALGPRPSSGSKPSRLLAVGDTVREALGDTSANLDSAPKLLRALRAAGIEVSSTSQWELAEHEHPAIPPVLQYKKLSRLLAANGWAWLDDWVHEGRYRPVYIPGGVVTGRWASSGGGALQIPRQLRTALRADPGWLLVSADVSQLEPRVLAAMAGDHAMITAGSGKDLYEGIVQSGAVASRQDAKIAMLGAMYGSTTGDSGRLVPRLRNAFPAAMRLVDDAATVGEQGGIVTTWLGRSSPGPGDEWHELQAAASLPGAERRTEDTARRVARERGRFTRNFVVQGTAAEWALAWMAELRLRLSRFEPAVDQLAHASGSAIANMPHLAFFLHDEVIVHTPRQHADAVARAVEDAAAVAGRRLFGDSPVDFRLDLHITERATKE